MAEEIRTGTILIKEGAIFPGSFRLKSKPYSNGWRLATDLDRRGLDLKIREAAWTFYYTRGEVKASVFGFDVGKATRRAIERVLADFLPSTQTLERELQEIAAILECTDREFLGPRARRRLEQAGGREGLQQAFEAARRALDRG